MQVNSSGPPIMVMTARQFQWTLGFWVTVATVNGVTLGAAVTWLLLKGGW